MTYKVTFRRGNKIRFKVFSNIGSVYLENGTLQLKPPIGAQASGSVFFAPGEWIISAQPCEAPKQAPNDVTLYG